MGFPQSNLLLDMLPAQDRAMLGHLESVTLPLRSPLYEADQTPKYVHFMTSGMASIVTGMVDGELAEVGIIGREGLPECLHVLGPTLVPTRCFIQIPGTALRMRYKDFERHFRGNEAIHAAVLRFVQYQSLILGQLTACNRLHEVEERLARWLLMVSDRLGESDVRLTQEFLAQMLGSRRTTVTVVAGTLQRGGLIEYKRGHVKILDRTSLADAACECYPVTEKLLRALYDGQSAAPKPLGELVEFTNGRGGGR